MREMCARPDKQERANDGLLRRPIPTNLAEIHGSTITQLARKVAKLKATIAVCRRLGAGQDLVAWKERKREVSGGDSTNNEVGVSYRKSTRQSRRAALPADQCRAALAQAKMRQLATEKTKAHGSRYQSPLCAVKKHTCGFFSGICLGGSSRTMLS